MLAPRAYQLRPLAARKASGGTLLVNLLAFYDFESLLVDVAHGNNLTNNNSASSTTGKVGNAVQVVAASSQYLSLAGNALLLNSADLTIQAWVYPDTVAASDVYGHCVCHHNTSEAAGNWFLSLTNASSLPGKVVFAHWRNTGADTTGMHTTTINNLTPVSTWTHIVARRTAGTYEIRVNDVAQSFANATTASGWGNHGFRIGRMYTGGGYSYDGRVDQVGIWNRSLSNAELTWLYNAGAGRSWAEVQAY